MRPLLPARGASPLLTLALLLSTPGLADAAPDPGPDGLAKLIAEVAEANQQLQDVGAAVQTQQESVNKAILDVQSARDNAAAAQQQVEASQKSVVDAGAAITDAQRKFDTFAAGTYVNGPAGSLITATSPDEIIASATAGQMLVIGVGNTMSDLMRAQTEEVNRESIARLAKKKADQATLDAQASQDNAVAELKAAQQTFADQHVQINQLAAQRDQATAKLAAARQAASPGSAGMPVGASAAAPAGPQVSASGPSGPAPAGPPPAGLGPKAGRGRWCAALR